MPASECVRSANSTGANERLYPLDVLKAVSIITVVAIHAFLPWGERNRPPFLLWLGLATIFAVPGFFFAAGFLAGRSRTDSVKLYWAQRLRRILAPYLLASALTLFLPHPLTGASWSSARDVLFALAFGSAWGPYYFVVVLVQLVLVTPLLWRLPTTLLAGLTIVFTATSFWYRVNPFFFTGSLFWALRHPFYWWGYYLLGMWMARTEFGRQFVSRGTANAWLLIALPIASVLLTASALYPLPKLAAATATHAYVHLAVFALVAVGAVLPRWAPLVWLSDASYPIYLYHLFFVRSIGTRVNQWGTITNRALTFLLALLATVAFVAVVRRVLGPKARTLFG